jgi:glycosyltransferase involved in cell wall biosynthesis
MMAERLDLLVVADSLEGGLGASAQAHARWFAARGWRVALAAPGAHDELHPSRAAVDLDVPEGAFKIVSMLRTSRVLRDVLRRDQPVVVHAHGARSQLLVLAAGRRPWVTMHGAGRVDGQGRVGDAARILLRRVAPFLSSGAFSAAPAAGRWRTLLHASPRLSGLPQMPASSANPPVFLWVGRLEAPKKPEIFVRACALAARERPLRGVMIGGGPLLHEIRAAVAEERAPVDVVGETGDVSAFLALSRAVVLFSGFEGVPFSVQEAMWAGRAVLMSPLPSLQWFAAGAADYANDPVEAAAVMVALCDSGFARRRGEEAAGRIRALLSPDTPFPQLMKAYQDAARSRPGRSLSVRS